MKWTTVVTAAPRYPSTLLRCCSSLDRCGFEPIVFCEPGTDTNLYGTDISNVSFIHNKSKHGAWHNWRDSINYALNTTDADLILSVQDDTLFLHPQTKALVEASLWPSPNCGFISLYTPSHYTWKSGNIRKPNGMMEMTVNNIYGACALVFPRQVLEAFRTTKTWDHWYGAKPASNVVQIMEERIANPSSIKHVDNAISEMMKQLNLQFWYYMPSLTQHIGQVSVLGHAPATGRRCASEVVDENKPLIQQIPLPTNLCQLSTIL